MVPGLDWPAVVYTCRTTMDDGCRPTVEIIRLGLTSRGPTLFPTIAPPKLVGSSLPLPAPPPPAPLLLLPLLLLLLLEFELELARNACGGFS